MTREEQIKEASIDFQIATQPTCIAGGAFADFAREMNVNSSFIAGAKWADETTIKKAGEWIKNHWGDFWLGNFSSIENFIEVFKKAMEE